MYFFTLLQRDLEAMREQAKVQEQLRDLEGRVASETVERDRLVDRRYELLSGALGTINTELSQARDRLVARDDRYPFFVVIHCRCLTRNTAYLGGHHTPTTINPWSLLLRDRSTSSSRPGWATPTCSTPQTSTSSSPQASSSTSGRTSIGVDLCARRGEGRALTCQT